MPRKTTGMRISMLPKDLKLFCRRIVTFTTPNPLLVRREFEVSAILPPVTAQSELRDEEVVARVLAGETALFEILLRRYNQRLYRVSRGILRDDSEAEDVMQDAYVRAYEHLNQFAGRAAFS